MHNRIAEFRKPLGLSQHRLAKKVGVKRHTIMAIEGEHRIPTLKVANDIAKILGKRLEEVFDLDSEDSIYN